MALEDLLTTGNIVTIVGTAASIFVSIQLFIFKWLRDSFVRLSNSITQQGHQMYEWLKEHEEKDMARHEENLLKFEKINVTIAKLEK